MNRYGIMLYVTKRHYKGKYYHYFMLDICNKRFCGNSKRIKYGLEQYIKEGEL